MGALNQPRDWHGRWASTGGSGAVYARNPRTRAGRGSVTFGLNPRRTRVGIVGRTAARSAGRTGFRPGSPIKGNKNVRYVSRTSAAVRVVTLQPSLARGLGRVASARGARQIARGHTPRRGYIVAYGPRGQAVLQRTA